MLLILRTQWTAEKQGALVGSQKKISRDHSTSDWVSLPGAFQQSRLVWYVSYMLHTPLAFWINFVTPAFP